MRNTKMATSSLRERFFSIFKTELQGWLLKAKGYFSHVQKGFFIARDKVDDIRREAYVLLRKG